MSSLEDLTPEQQEQALRLFTFVKQNPDLEKNIRREAKKKNPNFSAPDIELEDKLSEQREEFNKKLEEERNERLAEIQKQRRAEAHAKVRAAGLDPEIVEKAMVDESIGSYDTAIKYVQAQKSLAPPTHDSVTPMTMPDTKGLWENRNKWSKSEAFDAINDLKSRRAHG